MRRAWPFLLLMALATAACGSSAAPEGHWEGFKETPSWIIAVRLEVQGGNTIRASALSMNVEGLSLPAKLDVERQVKAALIDQWRDAARGQVDFAHNTITRAGGVAPLFVHDPKTGTMTFHFYAGGKLTEKVVCMPVMRFAGT